MDNIFREFYNIQPCAKEKLIIRSLVQFPSWVLLSLSEIPERCKYSLRFISTFESIGSKLSIGTVNDYGYFPNTRLRRRNSSMEGELQFNFERFPVGDTRSSERDTPMTNKFRFRSSERADPSFRYGPTIKEDA